MIFACLIGLADTLGKYQQQPPQDIWKAELTAARLLLSAWYEKHAELVDPPRLMDGSEIMQLLEIEPGPEVGKLIEEIREMQVSGVIQSRC